MEKLKKGGMLFLFFFKIGCFTFGGGWSILAQMEQEFVDRRKWMTKDDLLDLIAVGKSVPGIMITNIGMLFGYQQGGWFGGFCAVMGLVLPAVIILSVITFCYDAFKSNYWCRCVLEGIQAAVVPIIGSAALSLGKDVLKKRKGQIICIVTLLLGMYTNISNVLLVILGVAAAFLERGVKKHGIS